MAEKQLEDKSFSYQINHLKKALEAKQNEISEFTRENQKLVDKCKTLAEQLEKIKEDRKLDKRQLEESVELANKLNSQVKDLEHEKDFLDEHIDSMCVQSEDREELVKLLVSTLHYDI